MSKKSRAKESSAPVPIKLPDDMKSKIGALAQKSGLSMADIMRLSIERGLVQVEAMFDPAQKQAA